METFNHYLYLGVRISNIVLVMVVTSKCGFHPQSFRALLSSRTSGQLSAAKDRRNNLYKCGMSPQRMKLQNSCVPDFCTGNVL